MGRGFGAHSVIHRDSIPRLSEDLPVVIEVVEVIRYRPHSSKK